MYGQGSGSLSGTATGVSSAASAVAGIAVLPNTGGNAVLTVLSMAVIVAGALVFASFVFTRIVSRTQR